MIVLNPGTLQQLRGIFLSQFLNLTYKNEILLIFGIYSANSFYSFGNHFRFIMTVNIDGEKYEGSGASKKMAKHACARAALTKLYNMSFTPHMPGTLDPD